MGSRPRLLTYERSGCRPVSRTGGVTSGSSPAGQRPRRARVPHRDGLRRAVATVRSHHYAFPYLYDNVERRAGLLCQATFVPVPARRAGGLHRREFSRPLGWMMGILRVSMSPRPGETGRSLPVQSDPGASPSVSSVRRFASRRWRWKRRCSSCWRSCSSKTCPCAAGGTG